MSHTVQNQKKLLARVRRIKGQLQALEKALETEQDCANVLHLIAAVRGATDGLMNQVLEEHIRSHIAAPSITDRTERTQAAEELISALRCYLK